MRAWILGILLVVVGLALALGLWLLGYHLTGKWAFNRWKAERVAMGDHLDWKDLLPPVVPLDQNFAEAPLISGSVIEHGKVDPRFKSLSLKEEALKAEGDWQEGRPDDLAAIARAYGTKNLQDAFQPLEAAFKALDQASRRPGCHLPIAYEEGETPALLGFRGAVRTLRTRALWNLRSGHPDQALLDLQTCFRIADHLKAEPNLLCFLLRTAILKVSMQVVWEGLEDHLWGATQLEAIQNELGEEDLLFSMKLAWQGERQFFITSWTAFSENQPQPRFCADPGKRRIHLGLLGRGWSYRNMLVWCQFTSSMVDAQDPQAHRVYPGRLIEPRGWLKEMRFRRDLVMAQIALPALTDQVVRVGMLQAQIDEGAVTCALERYRLEKGRYPERLEDLPPSFIQELPHDLVTGGPLHYRPSDERFSLYQVGWNGVDESGTSAWKAEGGRRMIDPAKGDWAWPHECR